VNGHECSTFKEAAVLHGLEKDDREYDLCLEETALTQPAKMLRHLFLTLLVNVPQLLNTNDLFEKYLPVLSIYHFSMTFSLIFNFAVHDAGHRGHLQASGGAIQ
jgi:hypothetical protein